MAKIKSGTDWFVGRTQAVKKPARSSSRRGRLRAFSAAGFGGIRPTLRTRGLKRATWGNNLLSELAKDSEWGGNNFERAADGAAHRRGHAFSAAQVRYRTPSTGGGYTQVDRQVNTPFQLVYLDGIQHRMRPDARAKDFLQDIDLEYRYKAKVVRITDAEFNQDPINVIDRRVNWIGAVSFYGRGRRSGLLTLPQFATALGYDWGQVYEQYIRPNRYSPEWSGVYRQYANARMEFGEWVDLYKHFAYSYRND